MRVITANVNGIRSAHRKGFFDWLQTQQADVVCLQETKARLFQLDQAVFCPKGYHCYYHDAEKPGYSGVALFTKQLPLAVKYGLGWPVADTEGRYVEVELEDMILASIYFPSGTSSDARQTVKYDFLDRYLPYLQALKSRKKGCIISGDWNIAHKIIDLKNWRTNQKNSGFLPAERAWLDHLFDQEGYVDAFRVVNQEADQYTWWSNRRQSWDKNVGWRIDYQVITADLKPFVKNVSIYKEQRFSDHAPLTIDYDH